MCDNPEDKKQFINDLNHILPKDLLGDIHKYAVSTYILKWIDTDKLDWYEIAKFHPYNDISLYVNYAQYANKFHWFYICMRRTRPYLCFIKANIKHIDWTYLAQCHTKEEVELLKYAMNNSNKAIHDKKYIWDGLSYCRCKEVAKLLRESPIDINWYNLSNGNCKEAVQLLRENPSKINWAVLSNGNCKEAVQLLREQIVQNTIYQNKINWIRLSYGNCKEALNLLYENTDKIKQWRRISLCRNSDIEPERLRLLRHPDNPDRGFYKYGYIDIYNINDNLDKIEQLLKDGCDLSLNHWGTISRGECKKTRAICRNNLDKIQWNNLSINCKESIELLRMKPDLTEDYFVKRVMHGSCKESDNIMRKNMNMIKWSLVSGCHNKYTAKLIREQLDQKTRYVKNIDWEELACYTKDGLNILRDYPEKTVWKLLSRNKNIYEKRLYR